MDPKLKVEQYEQGLIDPEFVLELGGSLKTKSKRGDSDDGDATSILIWLGFTVAVLALVVIGIIYCVMRRRRKRMMLARAIAEGKVTMKYEEERLTEGNEND